MAYSQDQDQALPTASPPVTSPTPDANAASSPAGQDAGVESSPTTGATTPPSIAEAIRDAAKGMVEAEDSPSDATEAVQGDVPDGVAGPNDEPASDADASENGSDVPSQPKAETPAEEQPPFHKHPAWRRKQDQVRTLQTEVSRLKPQVDLVDELKTYTGGDQGFENARTLMRTFAHEPAKSVAMLERLLSDAKSRAGLVLASDDLKQKGDDGLLDESTALEIEQARVAKQSAEQALQEHHERQGQEQVSRQRADSIRLLNAWEEECRSNDPDYPKKQKLIIDRAWTLVRAEESRLNRELSAAEKVAKAKEAYDAISNELEAMMHKPREMRAVSSSGSSSTAGPDPKDWKTALRMQAAKMR